MERKPREFCDAPIGSRYGRWNCALKPRHRGPHVSGWMRTPEDVERDNAKEKDRAASRRKEEEDMTEDTYVDSAEVAVDLVDMWATLVVPAFAGKYGEQAARDLQTQTDSLRVTLLDLLEESHA